MEKAIKIAELSQVEDNRPHPKVGAMLIGQNNEVVVSAFRGEYGTGDHAEYLLLRKAQKLNAEISSCTLITTLEPCVKRGTKKTPCSTRIIRYGIPLVCIGMIDPNPDVRGNGIQELHRAGIDVQLAPAKIVQRIRQLNERFVCHFEE